MDSEFCTHKKSWPIYLYMNKNKKQEVGHLSFPSQKAHSANWPGPLIPSTLSWVAAVPFLFQAGKGHSQQHTFHADFYVQKARRWRT